VPSQRRRAAPWAMWQGGEAREGLSQAALTEELGHGGRPEGPRCAPRQGQPGAGPTLAAATRRSTSSTRGRTPRQVPPLRQRQHLLHVRPGGAVLPVGVPILQDSSDQPASGARPRRRLQLERALPARNPIALPSYRAPCIVANLPHIFGDHPKTVYIYAP